MGRLHRQLTLRQRRARAHGRAGFFYASRYVARYGQFGYRARPTWAGYAATAFGGR